MPPLACPELDGGHSWGLAPWVAACELGEAVVNSPSRSAAVDVAPDGALGAGAVLVGPVSAAWHEEAANLDKICSSL